MTRPEDDVIEGYDAGGKLTSLTNRAGLTQTLAYSDGTTNPPNGQTYEDSRFAVPVGFLIRIVDPFGRSLKFGYNGSGRLVRVTDPDNRDRLYTYSGDKLATITYPDGAVRTYHYNEPAHTGGTNLPNALTGVTDENGNRFATYAYQADGRAISTEHAGGAERLSFVYDASGTTSVTDALGATRTYSFQDSLGVRRLAGIAGPSCPSCGPAAVSYDANGSPASRTDWNGNVTQSTHDARGLETLRVEAAGSAEERRITTEWHPFYRLPVRMAEPLRLTTYTYGEPNDANPGNRGSVLSKTVRATTDASGAQGFSATPVGSPRSWNYTYNANGQVLTANGPRTDLADIATYTYHPNDDPDLGRRGQIATIANALGHLTQVTAYNAHGEPVTIVDPNGLATTLTYDLRQRLTSRSVGGETTSYAYDGVGQVTQVTLPDGSFLDYTYDAAHRLTAIADSLGNRIAYTLDLAGNRTREDVFDPGNVLAQTRSRLYSALNRLDQDIGGTNPAAQVTRFAYDNQGNVTGITDPLNRVTANGYDALNRLKQMTDPAAGLTRYGYDGRDQLASVTDPRNNATTYAVEGLGNLAAQSSPDTGNTAHSHDAAGNLLIATDAKGQATSFTYDALNRITRIVHSQATGPQLKQVDYGYDQGTNGRGRLTSISETSAAGALLQTTSYGYDQKGRVTSESRTIAGATHTMAYAYDAAGRMTGMTYPSGRTLAYGFDALGRVNRIETTGAGTTEVVLQDAQYHPFGPIKGFTFGNLQPYARSFDLDGRIASHSLASQTKTLAFDAASRLTRIAQQGVPANFADYGYDALDRLTSTVLPTSTFSYGYDAVGNRVSKSAGAGTDTYSYPATSNRLAAIAGSTPRTYTHDPNGSISADGLNGFGYDARGRLVSSSSAAGSTSYQVNALGQRSRKSSPLGDAVYHYDSQGRLIAESSPAGATIREYLYLADQPVAVAAYTQAGGSCPANPTPDTSNTFAAFNNLERLEVRSGRLGAADWEWGLGNNTQASGQFTTANLNWVNNKAYGFTLTYDGAGAATIVVRDGATELFSKTWSSGMDAGNALKLYVKSTAGIGAGNLIKLTVSAIDGQAVNDTLQTAGDGNFSEASRVFAGSSLQNGFTVEGTVTLTFAGSYPC